MWGDRAFATCPYPPVALPLSINVNDDCPQLTIGFGLTGVITNAGHITNLDPAGIGVGNSGNITTFTNTITGVINGHLYSFRNDQTGLATLVNSGTIGSNGAINAIYNNTNPGTGRFISLTNNTGGIISGTDYGVWNDISGTFDDLVNNGSITGSSKAGIWNARAGIFNSVTNSGTITSDSIGILNSVDGIVNSITNQNGGIISGSNLGISNNGNIPNITNQFGGLISGSNGAIKNTLGSTITNISNSGTINGQNGDGIYNIGNITGIITNANNGEIKGTNGIFNDAGGSINNFQNNGNITASNKAIYNLGTFATTFNNTGTIQGAQGFYNFGGGSINTIANNGNIIGNSGAAISNINSNINDLSSSGVGVIKGTIGIYNSSSSNITSLTNNNELRGTSSYALLNEGNITNFGNFGNLTGGLKNTNNITQITNGGPGVINGPGIINDSGATMSKIVNNGYIETILNLGSINGAGGGITNNPAGTINTLTNAQGVGNINGALAYTSKLPNYYNIVINQSGYGQIIVAGVEGKTTFGISTLSTNVHQGTLTNVVRGATAANFTSLNGTFTQGRQKYSFSLTNPNIADDWDLTIDYLGLLGADAWHPDVWNTYKTLASNRDALLGAMHQRYAVLNTVMEYDCSRFDKYGVCISFQARSTGWGTQTTGAGVLNIAYRIHPKIRVGAYLDYILRK
ncbi:hypothetical protein EB001_13150 [bacterium]|nr:hypothetical protein [bacterium]